MKEGVFQIKIITFGLIKIISWERWDWDVCVFSAHLFVTQVLLDTQISKW